MGGGRIRPLRNGSPEGRPVGPGLAVLLAASFPGWSPGGRAIPKRNGLGRWGVRARTVGVWRVMG